MRTVLTGGKIFDVETKSFLVNDELNLMVAGGMDPLDVLVATTQSAADLLGLGDEIGSLTPGKRADLTVISGDPLDFDAWTIESVWKSGIRVVG